MSALVDCSVAPGLFTVGVLCGIFAVPWLSLVYPASVFVGLEKIL